MYHSGGMTFLNATTLLGGTHIVAPKFDPNSVLDIVERVTPSILLGRREGLTRVDEFEARHVAETTKQLVSRSRAIAEGIDSGTLAIAGVTYQLADGRAVLREAVGDLGQG